MTDKALFIESMYLQGLFSKSVFVFICSNSVMIQLLFPYPFFMLKSQPILCLSAVQK